MLFYHNNIFIQGMDITGSQFLDLAQIEKTQKILKDVQCAPLSPTHGRWLDHLTKLRSNIITFLSLAYLI